MRHTSRYRLLVPVLGLLSMAVATLPARDAPVAAPTRHWQLRGSGIRAQAVWPAADGAARVSVRCDHGDPVLLLRVAPAQLPADAEQVTLAADSTDMDYPVQREGDSGLASKIALDAPILDRMLVAHRFALSAGGRTLTTGAPAEALARVVRNCRALHWPRDARIDPSDAGLAK